jgi:transposase-like protein
MAIDILGEDFPKSITKSERTTAMGRMKVVNQDDVHKDFDRILEGVCDKVKGMLALVLKGAREELAKELRGIGLMTMEAIMEMEITTIAGPKGKHKAEREYYRGGNNPGSVIMDDQKVPVSVPRAVHCESKASHQLQSYGLFHRAAGVAKRAYQDLIRGVSTRRFAEGIEKFLRGYGFSASSVSRHMVEATGEKLKDLMSRSIKGKDLVVLMLDGLRMTKDVTVLVALGIDNKGVKHILGVRQGSTENARVVKKLLEDLVERGLDTEQPLLVVIDGAKALRSGVTSVLGADIPVQRCIVHKMRNVEEDLPKKHRPWVHKALLRAYNAPAEDAARAMLEELYRQLCDISAEAAASLKEGLDETLTVHHLGLPPLLKQSLRSTNALESANQGVRNRTRNVKRWEFPKGAQQLPERWVAAGLLETEKGFRAIKGFRQIPILIAALEAERHQKRQAA